MTKLYDDPSAFAEDMLAGFLDVHSTTVVGVPGGVIRARGVERGGVAVVIGGGSGHYPAFCGLVGPGLAAGAVVGNVFTSPSADDVCTVAREAAAGGGVLLSFGNYAGDVMNFGLAQDRLRDEGIDVRTVLVTDDVASAPRDDPGMRRGIAGDFAVFKIAGAAAEAGYDLDGVELVAVKANERTRTLGVTFGGCTLPGQSAPLFVMPEGRMGVGMGIHGEPGISDEALPAAAELAARLVDGVLAERPPGAGERVAAILNGLGSTKYEELFVVWATVSRLLAEAGLVVVEPEVGELVTSLDMSGCSLTLVFLDDELETLWRAPAESPAYRKGTPHRDESEPPPSSSVRPRASVRSAPARGARAEASAASRACARQIVHCLAAAASALVDAEGMLGRLDAIAGDGDHGRGMTRGSAAALAAAQEASVADGGAAAVLTAAGDAWAGRAGGTSGALWGAALRSAGEVLGDAGDAVEPITVVDAVAAALEAMRSLGKARLGDKTMLDALDPFLTTFAEAIEAGEPLAAAWASAAGAADEAARSTAELVPRVGRARPLAAKSKGTPDPGAISLALMVKAMGGALKGESS